MSKVAIITRTKDRPLFLKRALQSVANQTFTDYTHVVVNDGGDQKVVDELIGQQTDEARDRIKVFHRPESSGAPDTLFNESIARVDSEYVAIHDDDDTWHPEFLQRTVASLDSGVKGVVARTDNVYEKIVDQNTIEKIKSSSYMSDMQAVSLYRQCLDNQLTAVAFVYRRDAYEAVGKYDDTLPVVGDWEFGIRFLLSYDVEYLDPGFALAYYHRRIDSDNSFKDHDHRKNITVVLNKYLRRDLAEGKLGVGYIMNDLRYEQDLLARTVRRLVPGPIAKLVRKRVRS